MDKEKRAEQIAIQILKYSRNELLVSLRFMDLALCKLEYKMEDIKRTSTDGKYLYYNPKHIFSLYEAGNAELNHSYLHTVFHCIFYHPFVNKTIERSLWDISCDIAVEGIISELNMKQLDCSNTPLINQELVNLKSKFGKLTAERLYREFLNSKIKTSEILRLKKIFSFDDHIAWYEEERESRSGHTDCQGNNGSDKSWNTEDALVPASTDTVGAGQGSGHEAEEQKSQSGNVDQQGNDGSSKSQNVEDILANANTNTDAVSAGQDSGPEVEWQEISERVKVDLETSSKEWGDRSNNLMQNITEANRETYDYTEFLQKFSVMGEEMQINDDEFDYIFYTYGLQLYGNFPLVEPLEYKDVKKVKEFVIAIDTSGSVQGELVKKFIAKTYSILSQQSNFFTKINVHIVQCDASIQKDDKITSEEKLEEFMQHIELHGFGGTDFRPVFEYVDDLVGKGEFENLKGLIYFTDGYGTFPEKKPAYDAAFIFIDDEYGQPQIPAWAIRLVLAKDEI